MNYKLLIASLLTSSTLFLQADDWPQHRNNASRSGSTSETLGDNLKPLWIKEFPAPDRAWKDKENKQLDFDSYYEPIVIGKRIFVGSMNDNSVRAYDTETGRELWCFYASGPVRFAPAGYKDTIFITSDDGFLYRLDIKTGKQKWKVRGGPASHLAIGNERMISMWPARTGAAVFDDKVYFAAGIWPFMGTFVHAVDAQSGKIIWTNSSEGMQYRMQPHSAGAFSGSSPQGYLTVTDSTVQVPSGRDKKGITLFRKTGLVDYSSKKKSTFDGTLILTDDKNLYTLYSNSRKKVKPTVYTYDYGKEQRVVKLDRRGKPVASKKLSLISKFIPVKGVSIKIKSGNRFFGIMGKTLVAIAPDGESSKIVWKHQMKEQATSILIADGKLFASTSTGRIHCFSSKGGNAKVLPNKARKLTGGQGAWAKSAAKMIAAADDTTGYALVDGVGSGELITELLAQSKMKVIVVDPSSSNVTTLRKKMSSYGVYGTRVTAFVGNPATIKLPKYFASLICSEKPESISAKKLYDHLRPYSGVMVGAALQGLPTKPIKQNGLNLVRRGALEGSADWTHHYSTPGNSVFSSDKRVKLPMGLLWFGGTTNDEVLPRHGHGPNPQVAHGRLLLEGADMLRCIDIYTGRKLWQITLKGLGKYYNTTAHFAGAGEIGSNYVSQKDFIYVIYKKGCLLIDAKTGKITKTFTLPGEPTWGAIRIQDDYLVAAIKPLAISLKYSSKKGADDKAAVESMLASPYASGSQQIVVMNRFTGKLLWKRKAEFNFRHNAIALSADRVFVMDRLSVEKQDTMRRYGLSTAKGKPKLFALDIATGKEIWKTTENVIGTFLSYSDELDYLVISGSYSRDRAYDDTRKGIAVLKGGDGSLMWCDPERAHDGPLLLCHDEFVTNGGSGGAGYDLKTGKANGWNWGRQYGCNTAIAAENFLFFRSGTAGFHDWKSRGGTGNFGGFKSGCSSNMIAAGGVLTIPDYTRTCGCSYQNKSSLALIHMPDIVPEYWTFGGNLSKTKSGINFGAPGNRHDDGLLWIGSHGGRSSALLAATGDEVKSDKSLSAFLNAKTPTKVVRNVESGVVKRVKIAGVGVNESKFVSDRALVVQGGSEYCHHSLFFMNSAQTPWIAASGLIDVKSLEFNTLTPNANGVIKLYFAEPTQSVKAGQRVFDVIINGKKVISDLDVVREAGSTRKLLIKTVKAPIAKKMTISFVAKKGESIISGIELNSGMKAMIYSGKMASRNLRYTPQKPKKKK